MQMRRLGVKLCCLIGHMTTMGVASLCISLPIRDHPEVIQKYLIPIYQMGNQWSLHYCNKVFIIYGMWHEECGFKGHFVLFEEDRGIFELYTETKINEFGIFSLFEKQYSSASIRSLLYRNFMLISGDCILR